MTREDLKCMPTLTRLMLGPSAKSYDLCSDETRRAMQEQAKNLLFTVLFCGILLSLSICINCFNRNFLYLPILLLISSWLYYSVDKPVVFTEPGPKLTGTKRWRIAIAIIFAMFNSLLIDSFYFSQDIQAARNKKIKSESDLVRNKFEKNDNNLTDHANNLYLQIDSLNGKLSNERMALNAEADGSSHTNQVGVGKIWHVKHGTYLNDSTDFANQIAQKKEEISAVDSTKRVNHINERAELRNIPSQISDGLSEKMDTLDGLIWKSGKPINIAMFILFFLVAMIPELVPFFCKNFYDVSEYFERTRKHRELKDQEVILAHTKDLEILAEESYLSLQLKQAEIKRVYFLTKLHNEIRHNKTLNCDLNSELDRLQALEDDYKQKYPRFYETHLKVLFIEAYERLFATVKASYL